MAVIKLDPQPANLAANEYAVDADGVLVAVSVHTHRLENGAGVHFLGTARQIDKDGNSCRCGNGNEVKTVLGHTSDLNEFNRLGQGVIAKQIMLALLGEPLDTEEVDDKPCALIPWGEEVLASWNIKTAAAIGAATGPAAIDPADVLGL